MFQFFKVRQRLSEVEDRLRKAEGDLAQAKLDWDELYEKTRHMMGRVAKRAALVTSADEAPEATPLSRREQINAAILQRRRGIRAVED